MATSRGRRYPYQQPYGNQRPNQGMMPYNNMPPTQQRGPLIQQSPMGIPHQFAAAAPHGRGVPQLMFSQTNPQIIPARPPGHFHQPPFPSQGGYYAPHPMMQQNPTPQIITNPSINAPKGGSSLVNFTPPPNPPAPVYQQQSQSKKRSNAIAIINPDTKEEVNLGGNKSPIKAGNSTTSISSTTSVSSTTPTNEVVVEFRSKVQGALNPESVSVPKPNAIISLPTQERTSSGNSIKPATDGDITATNSSQSSDSSSVLKPDANITQQKASSTSSDNLQGETISATVEQNISTTTSPSATKNTDNVTDSNITPAVTTSTSVKPTPVDISSSKDVTRSEPTPMSETGKVVDPTKQQKATKEDSIKEDSIKVEPKVHVKSSQDSAASEKIVEGPSKLSPLLKEKKGSNDKDNSVRVPSPTKSVEVSKEEGGLSQRKPQGEPEKQIPAPFSVQVKQEEQTKVPEKKSLLGEPVGHMTITTTPPTVDDELEEGEIPPNDPIDSGMMNGNIEDVDFDIPDDLADHDQRKYDRNFLLEYRRLATDPPEQLRQMLDVFCPHGVDMTITYRKAPKPSKKVIDHKPQAFDKVELHKADKRWVRTSDQEIPEEERQTQELFKKFQGILNKLTPQKFSDLAMKAQALDINTEDRLHGCIDRIFEKALEEPNFSIAYANLCRVMSNIKVNVVRSNEEGVEVIKETSFRRELLTKCQKEFEKDKKDDIKRDIQLKAIEEATSEEVKKKKKVEFDEWETVARRRSLGNIRFIGELFKLKMLSEGIMHDCILRLLRSTSDHESLECFCRLITTTGKELDHTQAKMRLDKYFERISEIIEKKKISSRIRFMLQDVQDLRKCDWIPRRQEGLKTIDQIHHEAKIEEMAEQEMIKQMAVTGNVKSYPRDDKKRGGKSGGQDDFMSTSSRPRSHEKRGSAADVNKILTLRKKDGGQGTTVGVAGGSLRPSSSGWGANRKKDGLTPPPVEKGVSGKSAPQKSSSAGNKRQTGQTGSGRGGLPGRRSSSQPNEKLSVLNALSKVVNQPGAGAPPTSAPKKAPALDEDTIRRKTGTIVDEFAENKDQNEAIVCVEELDSSSLLHVFMSEAILHTLEKSSHSREYAGKLLECLFRKKVITKDKLHSGLKEVVDMIEDLEVDIPKVWNFMAEILSPLFVCECFVLTEYYDLITEAGIGYKAPRALARLLHCVHKSSKTGTACDLWTKSKLTWTKVGLDEGEDERFIEDEKLQFLSPPTQSSSSSFDDPPYFKDLVVMFGRPDTSNDDILEWIEAQKISVDKLFIRTLSRASIDSSTTGDGDSCILSDENFRKRLPIVKKWVDENEAYQLEVLNAMQFSTDILRHPPGMLGTVFWSLYDVEVVSETVCYEWKKRGKESAGRGMALQTVKRFFDWLDGADQESDNNS